MSLNWKKASFGYSPQYDQNASETFSNIGGNFSKNYDGNVLDSANGTTFYDLLSIDGGLAINQEYAQITSIAYNFYAYFSNYFTYNVSKL